MATTYNIANIIDDDDELQQLKRDLFEHMVSLEQDQLRKLTPKMFFGEGDGHDHKIYDSIYSKRVNYYKICTLSRVDHIGHTLNVFLEDIINNTDHWENILRSMIDNEYEQIQMFTINRIMEHLSDSVSQKSKVLDANDIRDGHVDYIWSYPDNDAACGTGEQQVQIAVCDIDMWDIYRIGAALDMWNANKRYENKIEKYYAYDNIYDY